MCVNTGIFCANKRIFVFCKSFCYSDVCGSPVITPYITSMSSSVFEIGCVSQVKTRFKQPFVVLSVTFPHLSSPRYGLCTLRTQVSYSSVVEVCFVHCAE